MTFSIPQSWQCILGTACRHQRSTTVIYIWYYTSRSIALAYYNIDVITGSSMIIIGGFISAFCPDYTLFIICRALVGFGVGGISVPFDLLAEYLPTSHRGKFLMYG